MKLRLSTLSGLMLVGLLPVPVVAQQAGPAVEEIIVTAQKREERLQDTPLSITAFTGDAIEDLGLRQSVDITAQTPNFSVGYPNGETGVPALFIRGVGLNDFGVLNEGPIASYTDQVYIASNAAQIFQLLDVERVEVLRGPQGTLYGRNATGGAVNFVSRKPTPEWDGWARAGYGTFETSKLEGAIGGPISDNLSFRATALKADSGGWLENELTGNDQNGVDELAWRLLVDAQVAEGFDLLFNLHGGNSESDSVQYQHLGTTTDGTTQCTADATAALQCVDAFGYTEQSAYTTPFTQIDLPAVSDYDKGSYDLEAQNDTEFWGGSVTATWDVGDFTLTSITAYDDIDDSRPEETDASPNDLITGVLAVEQETFSQELRLDSQHDTWSWLAGVYYLRDEATDLTSFDILRALRPGFIGDNVLCPTAPPGNPTGFCAEQFVFEQQSSTEQEITSYSAFVDATFDLTSALGVSVGLRYTNEKVEQDVSFFFAEPAAGNPPIFSGSDDTDFSNVSGRAVIDYRFNDDVMIFAGVATGFKAGGIQSTTSGIFPYEEEQLVSYEVGAKSILADGRIRLNASAFMYDYSDLQVFTFVIVGGTPFSILTNAADAKVVGAEVELQTVPTENWLVNLGLGLLDTEYEDFQSVGDDLSGNEITLSPEMTFNGLVQYDVPLGGNGRLTFQVDFNYKDEVFFDSLNNPLLSEDDYWLYNGRVSWTSTSEQWEVAAWGRNLGDEEYLVYAFDLSFLGFHERMLGTPRSFGVEVSYQLAL